MERMFEVKSEYVDRWFWDQEPHAVSESEIAEMASEWDMTIEELMEQVTEI